MNIFNDDRSTLNETAAAFDASLSSTGFDEALHRAFDSGMNLDDILYIVYKHTDRIVGQSAVQYRLKKAANKDRQI